MYSCHQKEGKKVVVLTGNTWSIKKYITEPVNFISEKRNKSDRKRNRKNRWS